MRGLVIFGLHDLGLSAPFPHIDLVLCRNVLMYFTRELQSRSLQAFAFSLRNGGYLVLGSAESTSPAAEYFSQVLPTLKLYRRIGNRVLFPMPIPEALKPIAPGMAHRRGGVPGHPSARVYAVRPGK
jgi:two-component system CheB/CheR fusion protein